MLDLKALLAKMLNVLPQVSTNHIIIGDIGICWGVNRITANSALTAQLPITYSTTTGMVCVANCEYWSSGTYIAPTVSVQKYTTYINLYARVSTSLVPNGYYINWVTIGKV